MTRCPFWTLRRRAVEKREAGTDEPRQAERRHGHERGRAADAIGVDANARVPPQGRLPTARAARRRTEPKTPPARSKGTADMAVRLPCTPNLSSMYDGIRGDTTVTYSQSSL